jgi:hypothetical protein
LKLPQSALPHVTDQFATGFCGPFVIVAAIPAVPPVAIVAGGVNPGVKVTTIAGIVEFWFPQAGKSIQHKLTSASSASLRPFGKLIRASPKDVSVIRIDCDGSLTRTLRQPSSAFASTARDKLFTNF